MSCPVVVILSVPVQAGFATESDANGFWFQYCEYYVNYDKCKEWLQKNLPKEFEKLSVTKGKSSYLKLFPLHPIPDISLSLFPHTQTHTFKQSP